MTKNQIEYGKLTETRRSNLVGEAQKAWRDTQDIALGHATLGETRRHNLASENLQAQTIDLGRSQLGETSRHNLATESIQSGQLEVSQGQLRELGRHNLAQEVLQQQKQEEDKRAHMASEAIGRSQVGAQYAQINLGYSQLAEAERTHRVNEGISEYQAETARSRTTSQNLTDIWGRGLDTLSTLNSMRRTSEEKRHNLAGETIDRSRLEETTRHNIVNERQGWTSTGIDLWNAASRAKDSGSRRIQSVSGAISNIGRLFK